MLCLRSLVATGAEMGQAGRLEVIVQDDASGDFDALKLIHPPVAAARNDSNLGFAANCNAGARRAQGDLLLFLNQDTVARPGWFEPLVGMFANPAVGIVGPKLVFPAEDGREESIQSCGGLYDGGKGPFHRFLGWAADDWRVNLTERVSWVTGAALCIWRDLFWRVGGFDTRYERGYFEDVALCEAVKQQGAEVWYCAEAVFEHKVGSTGGIPAHIFRANSDRFHREWDHRITADTPARLVNY